MTTKSDLSAKKNLRKILRKQRNALQVDFVRESSEKIKTQLSRWLISQDFDAIAAYFCIGKEPEVHLTANHYGCREITWYFPKVSSSTRMDFFSWRLGEPLRTGWFDIPEPTGGEKLRLENQRILFLVPCLAVDINGTRLGSGGGYYDRYLAQLPQSCRPLIVAVCFDALIQTSILPREVFDIPVDGVLSESGLRLIQRP